MPSTLESFFLFLPDRTLLRLLSFMDPAEFVALMKTSTLCRYVVQYFMSHAWDFDLFFHSWFPGRTKYFRDLLEHTGGVVSGSQALQFFDRSRYAGSDLDIFVRAGGYYPLSTFLMSNGYLPFVPNKPASGAYRKNSATASKLAESCIRNMDNNGNSIIGVYNFRRISGNVVSIDPQRGESGADAAVVQIVVVDSEPVHHIIFEFHSTGVMNFISSQEAVSIFAKHTLIDRVSYVANPKMIKSTPKWLDKYISRGFRMIHSDSDDAEYHGPVERYVGDRECFRYRFPVERQSRDERAIRDKIYGDLNKKIRFVISTDPPAWEYKLVALMGCLKIVYT